MRLNFTKVMYWRQMFLALTPYETTHFEIPQSDNAVFFAEIMTGKLGA